MPTRSKVLQISTALFSVASVSFLYWFLFIPPFLPTEGNGIGDSLLYLAPGQRMYQGESIYRDVFEYVPPGTAVVNSLMFKIFGLRPWIPDLLALLLGLGLFWVGVVISRKLMPSGLALLPSAVFVVSARGFLNDPTHHWYSVLAALAAIAVLLEKRTTPRIAAAGLLCGIGGCFTQTRGLASVLGFAVFLWWESRQRQQTRRELLKKEAWLLCSFLAALLAVNAYFIWEAGPARYFWCTVVFIIKYYPKGAYCNGFQTLRTEFPVFTSLGAFIDSFSHWVFFFVVVPLVFVLFFALYWRKFSHKPLEQRERPMLLAIVGVFMLLSIAPAPDYPRLAASAPPALILLIWLLYSSRKFAQTLVVALTAGTLIAAFYLAVASRPHPVGILEGPHGEVAFTDSTLYQEDIWIQQHTHPSEYFYEPLLQDAYFYLDLRNPTPLSSIENNGYTPPEQVAEAIRGLNQHQVRYILWSPQALDIPETSKHSSKDYLGPLRDYLHSNYTLVKVFSNGDGIWGKKTE
jgi:hypothetical protein